MGKEHSADSASLGGRYRFAPNAVMTRQAGVFANIRLAIAKDYKPVANGSSDALLVG
jgi:hypothetical protein